MDTLCREHPSNDFWVRPEGSEEGGHADEWMKNGWANGNSKGKGSEEWRAWWVEE